MGKRSSASEQAEWVESQRLKTNLLEPDLERSVENGDEGNGLLGGSLGDVEEESLVLGGEKLVSSGGVVLEERVGKLDRLVERGERLKEGVLGARAVDAGEPLFDSSEPVAGEVSERDVNPSVLLGDVHESDHASGDLLVRHVADVGDDGSVLLLSKPGLVKVGVEALDDVVLLTLEPGRSLLLGYVEDGVVELSPELDGSGSDLVDGLAELGSNGEDASGLLVVCSLPVVVIDSGGGDDELLDGLRGVSLLGNHDSRRVEDSVERHRLSLEHLDGPVSGEAEEGDKER
jgi:hypothetical protein